MTEQDKPDNRHPRNILHKAHSEHSQLGWVIDLMDDDVRLNDGREPEGVDLQIKPHPSGFQYTLWWKEDGEKKQRDGVIRFEDPRDAVEQGMEKAAETMDGDEI